MRRSQGLPGRRQPKDFPILFGCAASCSSFAEPCALPGWSMASRTAFRESGIRWPMEMELSCLWLRSAQRLYCGWTREGERLGNFRQSQTESFFGEREPSTWRFFFLSAGGCGMSFTHQKEFCMPASRCSGIFRLTQRCYVRSPGGIIFPPNIRILAEKM